MSNCNQPTQTTRKTRSSGVTTAARKLLNQKNDDALAHKVKVADSPQVNGIFKIEMSKQKGEYMQYKGDNEGLNVTDIVPLVRSAFARSFANMENARKAIQVRGWGPALNYRLLLDPRLSGKPTDTTSNDTTSNDTATTCNGTNGSTTITDSSKNSATTVSASIVATEASTVKISIEVNQSLIGNALTDAIVDYRNKDEGRERLVQEKIQKFKNKQLHIETIKKIRTLSSGQMMSNRWLRLDNTVLENRTKRKQEDEEQKQKQLAKRQKRDDNQQERYQSAINKCMYTKETLTIEDYTGIVKQITNKGDSPLRKTKEAIVQQINRRFDRLEKYLPLTSCESIREHIRACSSRTKATKRSKPEKVIFDDARTQQNLKVTPALAGESLTHNVAIDSTGEQNLES